MSNRTPGQKSLPTIFSIIWNPSPVSVVLIGFLAVYLLTGWAAIHPYQNNPTAMIHFGHYYVDQNQDSTPDGAVVFTGNEEWGGNGYDGQIFYYYARTLFKNGTWPVGFQDAYRAPRVGYPLMGALFSFLGSWGVVMGLILSQLLLHGLALGMLHSILPGDRKFLSWVYALSPFQIQSWSILVSDGVTMALLIIGFVSLLRFESGRESWKKRGWMVLAFLSLSLSVLTKESSLLLLFPVGLLALFRKDFPRILLLLAILLPMVLWQIYLRQAHGMVPAGILRIFLSPLDGVLGLIRETPGALEAGFSAGLSSGIKVSLKLMARWLLVGLIVTAFWSVFTGDRKKGLEFRLGSLLVLLTVLLADHYYFWSVYENISRMFTPLVISVLLLVREDSKTRSRPFFFLLGILFLMVVFRTLLLTPDFPWEIWHPYHGPDYSHHAPVLSRGLL